MVALALLLPLAFGRLERAPLLPRCKKPEGERVALVTGITGMLGSHVAEELLEQGYKVVGVLRPRAHSRAIASLLPLIEVEYGELTDPYYTVRLIERVKPHVIFHFAAQAFNGVSYTTPDYTLDSNTRMCLGILEGMRMSNSTARLFFAGSSTVYGATTETWDGPIPETAPMAPVSPYGVSKAANELLLLQYWRAYKLDVVVGRFFIHLATRGTSALALHEFSRQVSRIEAGLQEPVLKHGNLETSRDITDIRDSAPSVICITEHAAAGEVFNIGSGRSFTMRQVLEMTLQATTKKIELQHDPSRGRAYDEKVVLADASKLSAFTGFKAAIPLEDTARMILDYWRQETAGMVPGRRPEL